MIRSTIDGLILDVPVKAGNSVIMSNTFNDGTTIATVARMTPFSVVTLMGIGRIHGRYAYQVDDRRFTEPDLDATLEYISLKS